MRTQIARIVGLAVVGVAIGAMAQDGPEGGPWRPQHGAHQEGPGGGREAMIKKLLDVPEVTKAAGISDEQIATLRDARFDFDRRAIDLRAELEKAGLDQARLMTQPEIDEAAVMSAVEHAGQVRTELAKLKIQQLLLVKKTLTEEQLQKLREVAKERMRHGRDGRDRHQRGRGKGMNKAQQPMPSPDGPAPEDELGPEDEPPVDDDVR